MRPSRRGHGADVILAHGCVGWIGVPPAQSRGAGYHPLKAAIAAGECAAAAGNQGSRRWQPYAPPCLGRWKTRADDRRRPLERPPRAPAPCRTRITAQFRRAFTGGALGAPAYHGSTAVRRPHGCSDGDSSRLGGMVAGASGPVPAAGTRASVHGQPSAGRNRGVRARALFPPLENSAGGRSAGCCRRYPTL